MLTKSANDDDLNFFSCPLVCPAIARMTIQRQILTSHGFEQEEWDDMCNGALAEALKSVSQSMSETLSLGHWSVFLHSFMMMIHGPSQLLIAVANPF